ncbi:MAG: bifunctional 2-polyprenyl-6-hydroxyphenol methylase/3-demethylubiquinol 3-O-methyltransferase UbiG [Bdellovibrionales bacterium]
MTSVIPEEIAHFAAHAKEWHEKKGMFASLHALTTPRMAYIQEQCSAAFGTEKTMADLEILDLGCGGGLMSEALAMKGCRVKGIDACAESIEAAAQHAKTQGLSIDYSVETAESLAARKETAFDLILALDVIEHVGNVSSFLESATKLLKKEGILILSTLNRTKKSFLFSIVGAEYIMGQIPLGTHDYEKFISPHELTALCKAAGLEPMDIRGLVYRPFRQIFELETGKNAINYFLTARKA